MWVKNKNTGLVWEVVGELAERLSRSPDFEVLPEPAEKSDEEKQEKPQPKKKSPGKNT